MRTELRMAREYSQCRCKIMAVNTVKLSKVELTRTNNQSEHHMYVNRRNIVTELS